MFSYAGNVFKYNMDTVNKIKGVYQSLNHHGSVRLGSVRSRFVTAADDQMITSKRV